jgi:hypothetical protein
MNVRPRVRSLHAATPVAILLAVASTMALLVTACSSDDTSDAQPAPDASVFVPGGFDELPRYRGSEEIGTRSTEGDVVTQSFSAEGTSPELVIEFYRDELTGWEETPTDDVGETLRTEFRRDGKRLELSATTIDVAGPDQQPTVQYSFVYHQ